MVQDVSASFLRYGDRFHHPAACFTPVAGVDIDVPTPQAFGTVVGVAVSFNKRAAIAAGEIFDAALELFVPGRRDLPVLILTGEIFDVALELFVHH